MTKLLLATSIFILQINFCFATELDNITGTYKGIDSSGLWSEKDCTVTIEKRQNEIGTEGYLGVVTFTKDGKVVGSGREKEKTFWESNFINHFLDAENPNEYVVDLYSNDNYLPTSHLMLKFDDDRNLIYAEAYNRKLEFRKYNQIKCKNLIKE